MDVDKELQTNSELELSESLNEWHSFNISNGSTKLQEEANKLC